MTTNKYFRNRLYLLFISLLRALTFARPDDIINDSSSCGHGYFYNFDDDFVVR